MPGAKEGNFLTKAEQDPQAQEAIDSLFQTHKVRASTIFDFETRSLVPGKELAPKELAVFEIKTDKLKLPTKPVYVVIPKKYLEQGLIKPLEIDLGHNAVVFETSPDLGFWRPRIAEIAFPTAPSPEGLFERPPFLHHYSCIENQKNGTTGWFSGPGLLDQENKGIQFQCLGYLKNDFDYLLEAKMRSAIFAIGCDFFNRNKPEFIGDDHRPYGDGPLTNDLQSVISYEIQGSHPGLHSTVYDTSCDII